jgi:hypothetical protein
MKPSQWSFNQLKGARLFVGTAGGEVSALTSDGEVVWSLGVAPGSYPAGEYAAFLQPGHSLEVSGDAYLVSPRPPVERLIPSSFGDRATDTAARQEPLVETQEDIMARKMAATMRGVTDRLNVLERQNRAYQLAQEQSQRSNDAPPDPDPAPDNPVQDEEPPQAPDGETTEQELSE